MATSSYMVSLLSFLIWPSYCLTANSDVSGRLCAPAYVARTEYFGCYTNSATNNALPSQMNNPDNLGSPESCARVCGLGGFSFCGVGNSTQCSCLQSIEEVGIMSNASSCNDPCLGNPTSFCGGSSFMNMYKIINPIVPPVSLFFPDCSREPLCSNEVCNRELSPSRRASSLIGSLTIGEKMLNLVSNATGVPRLGLPAYKWQTEGLHGLARSPGVVFAGGGNFSAATSFPQAISSGAAFDDDLVEAIANVISTEARAFSNYGRSALGLWTPNINPFKDPRWGRGQETPGEDPYHLQRYVAAFIRGLQGNSTSRKVIATCKHFAAYDLEGFGNITRLAFDALVTPQELSEYYLPPFKSCATSNVGAFMCSYNSLNGIPACADPYLLQTILREHWGWDDEDQWVTSDCGAVQLIWAPIGHNYTNTLNEATAVALKAGTDLECNPAINADFLGMAYNQSLISENEIDKALTRLYSSLVKVGYFDPPQAQPLRSLGWESVNTTEAQKVAYAAAVSGIVLIKNDGILPLSKNKSIALVGPWANATTQMQGNYYGVAPYLKSPLSAARRLGLSVEYALGANISDTDPSSVVAVELAKAADVIIFMGGIDNTVEAESLDRNNIMWPGPQLSLLRSLFALNKPIIVVQMGGGQVDDSELLNGNSSVNALLWAGYPGQEGGAAIFDIIVGNAAPAGRLPVTQYPTSYADVVPEVDMALRPGPGNANLGRTHIWYTGDPIVQFGSGLHYTDFNLSWGGNIHITPSSAYLNSTINIQRLILARGTYNWLELLAQPVLTLPLEISNVGTVKSDFVALLFLKSTAGPEPWPKQTLVSYSRAHDIMPNSSSIVELTVNIEGLVRVDETGSRVLYPGQYTLFVDLDAAVEHKITLTGEPVMLEYFPQPPRKSL